MPCVSILAFAAFLLLPDPLLTPLVFVFCCFPAVCSHPWVHCLFGFLYCIACLLYQASQCACQHNLLAPSQHTHAAMTHFASAQHNRCLLLAVLAEAAKLKLAHHISSGHSGLGTVSPLVFFYVSSTGMAQYYHLFYSMFLRVTSLRELKLKLVHLVAFVCWRDSLETGDSGFGD